MGHEIIPWLCLHFYPTSYRLVLLQLPSGWQGYVSVSGQYRVCKSSIRVLGAFQKQTSRIEFLKDKSDNSMLG